jgi:hypothetical protein
MEMGEKEQTKGKKKSSINEEQKNSQNLRYGHPGAGGF